MPRMMKYSALTCGFLVIAFSGALAVAHNFGGLTAHSCMQMMQGMHAGSSERPNEQWRQQR